MLERSLCREHVHLGAPRGMCDGVNGDAWTRICKHIVDVERRIVDVQAHCGIGLRVQINDEHPVAASPRSAGKPQGH